MACLGKTYGCSFRNTDFVGVSNTSGIGIHDDSRGHARAFSVYGGWFESCDIGLDVDNNTGGPYTIKGSEFWGADDEIININGRTVKVLGCYPEGINNL